MKVETVLVEQMVPIKVEQTSLILSRDEEFSLRDLCHLYITNGVNPQLRTFCIHLKNLLAKRPSVNGI